MSYSPFPAPKAGSTGRIQQVKLMLAILSCGQLSMSASALI